MSANCNSYPRQSLLAWRGQLDGLSRDPLSYRTVASHEGRQVPGATGGKHSAHAGGLLEYALEAPARPDPRGLVPAVTDAAALVAGIKAAGCEVGTRVGDQHRSGRDIRLDNPVTDTGVVGRLPARRRDETSVV